MEGVSYYIEWIIKGHRPEKPIETPGFNSSVESTAKEDANTRAAIQKAQILSDNKSWYPKQEKPALPPSNSPKTEIVGGLKTDMSGLRAEDYLKNEKKK